MKYFYILSAIVIVQIITFSSMSNSLSSENEINACSVSKTSNNNVAATDSEFELSYPKIDYERKREKERERLREIILLKDVPEDVKNFEIESAIRRGIISSNDSFFTSLKKGVRISAKGLGKGVSTVLEETLDIEGDTRRKFEREILLDQKNMTRDGAFDSSAGFGRMLGEKLFVIYGIF